MTKLYLVPTPIGNLKDITLRALEVLKTVDIIAAEDTRQTLKLLNHYEIKKTLISYHKHNEYGKSEDIIGIINSGRSVAIVSDAGTPGISDPGEILVKRCIEENIQFEVLPGATATTTALVYSGFDTTKFMFRGFLPRENKDRMEVVDTLKDRSETIIFYEAPHRLLSTLDFLKEVFGDRRIAICRELTKLHEEIVRVTISEAISYFSNKQPKGEFVLVLEGKSKEAIENEKKATWEDLSIEEHILRNINNGMEKKEAIKMVAKERKLPKSEVYKYSTNM
ncbi:ribosomal RNA small subunit methyltransferase I [Clostridium folliculivorans]|uniref:Ribosomal RNA small subunit methyltransferase I n=2 Tax=Clostridium folliculivorans TaxID=2886038 RepID=A0A9W5Y5H2_9CLOT|nr:ribosomal RNA small subunit methyltransferase I [Clostridium folliculivorans]GKU31551.1 ribosomal RNA small subunit methyltransferase I [Clostridium folliculivorans]